MIHLSAALNTSRAVMLALFLSGCAGTTPGAPEPPVLVIEKMGADGASTITGGSLLPTVRLTRGGSPVPGAVVDFAAAAGGGSVPHSRATTGPDGQASTLWILGPETGQQRLTATVDGQPVEFSALATDPRSGETHSAQRGYAEYVAGDLPIIIAAPHGGDLTPAEIPDRTYGATVQDLNTADLARRIAAELHRLSGRPPHLVIANLHRRKLDPNREIVEAAQENLDAERAWSEYHAFIETAQRQVTREHGSGLFVDVHGHGHEIQRLEIGYLLTATDLSNADAVLDQGSFRSRSSIRHLAESSSLPFSELLRGERSLGSILDGHGYPAVPAAADPAPGDDPYFSGGYSTRRHGSRDGGTMDAVQIEANRHGIRDTAANRQRFAEALAISILEYLESHTDLDLANRTMSSKSGLVLTASP